MVIRLKVPIEMHYTVIPMGTSKVNSSQLNALYRVTPTKWRSYRDHGLCYVTSPYVKPGIGDAKRRVFKVTRQVAGRI